MGNKVSLGCGKHHIMEKRLKEATRQRDRALLAMRRFAEVEGNYEYLNGVLYGQASDCDFEERDYDEGGCYMRILDLFHCHMHARTIAIDAFRRGDVEAALKAMNGG